MNGRRALCERFEGLVGSHFCAGHEAQVYHKFKLFHFPFLNANRTCG